MEPSITYVDSTNKVKYLLQSPPVPESDTFESFRMIANRIISPKNNPFQSRNNINVSQTAYQTFTSNLPVNSKKHAVKIKPARKE